MNYEDIMEAKRITWLDGVKGFACLAVMWHHFVLSFLPQLYSDEISTMKSVSELDRKLQQSPFLFWLNGDFMVMLFLTISGIVMSKKVIELTDKTSLSEIIVKRYFRLLLPFVPLAIMTYLFIQFGWFRNGEAGIISTSMWLSTCHAEQMSFLRFIFETVIHTWFGGDNNFGLSCVFWMLPAIFQGSFLVIILGTITWKVKPLKSLLIFLVLAAIMIFVQPLYTPFCLGAVFSVYYKNYFNKKNKWGGAIALILGCFLGGYPTGVSPTNVYRHLNFLPDYIITYLFWHLIGAILVIYGLANLCIVQKLLSRKVCFFLGKISYAVYIWHTFVLCTVSSYCYIFLQQLDYNQKNALVDTFVITNIVVILWAFVYSKYVESKLDKLLKKLLKWLTA